MDTLGESIRTVIMDWRWPATALLAGGVVGRFFFKIAPLPRSANSDMNVVLKAAAAVQAAEETGEGELRRMATIVGAAGVGRVMKGLRQQQRGFLVLGVVVALILVGLGFCLIPSYGLLPSWLYVVAGVGGVLQIAKSW